MMYDLPTRCGSQDCRGKRKRHQAAHVYVQCVSQPCEKEEETKCYYTVSEQLERRKCSLGSLPGVVLCGCSVGEAVVKGTRTPWCSQTDQSPPIHAPAQATQQPCFMFLFSSDSSSPLFCYLLTNSKMI